jgi:hypothetical protein
MSEQGAEALRAEVGEKTRGPDRQVRRAAVAEGERGAAAVEYLAHGVVCSSTSRASVYDVIRMLSRERRPTPLGDAIAHNGRISTWWHILRLAGRAWRSPT